MTISADPSSAPLRSMGIVGGGQLAWMLAEAAEGLGVDLHVQTPNGDDPATSRASSVVVAALDDVSATRLLAERCAAVSFENEWIPLDALAPLAVEGVQFVPSLQALEPLVDKRRQRQLLDALHLPTLRWCCLEETLQPPEPPLQGDGESGDAETVSASGEGSLAEWLQTRPAHDLQPSEPCLPEGFAFPVMAKATSGGYDGRGTRLLHGQADLEALLAEVEPSAWILEELVRFEQELALVACRDRHGRVELFPLVQTHQHRQVCDWVLFPAAVDHAVEAFARNIAASLLTALDYVGVLSIEFFYGPGGLQINELAPRTHNSGHYTIEACQTSQFAQQVRIVTGQPMGSTQPRLAGALMVNLLGTAAMASPEDVEDRLERLRQLPGVHLHWYGKRGQRPGRKLGHLTIPLQAGSEEERRNECRRWLEQVRAIWPRFDSPAAARAA
jgi:5-(carboxyamino)imidazole ribonucleotide synthase